MNPFVSILMPVYNVAPYLEASIDSILHQTYQDFEFIILDDCSSDNSAEMIDQYKDDRIVRYRGEKNVGLANILNIGMEMARGKYIVRMDSDDISLPNRIEVQVKYMEKHPKIDLCSCAMQLFGERDEVWVRDTNVEDVKITALFYSPILHASSIWRRESFEKAYLKFNQEMVPAEDYDMWVRALCMGLRLVNIKDILYKYRIREGSSTENIFKSQEKCKLIIYNYLSRLFPSLSKDVCIAVSENRYDTWDNVLQLGKKFQLLEDINKEQIIPFFNVRKLHNRLKLYHQNKTYEAIRNGNIVLSVKMVCKLRIRQIVKLLISRL